MWFLLPIVFIIAMQYVGVEDKMSFLPCDEKFSGMCAAHFTLRKGLSEPPCPDKGRVNVTTSTDILRPDLDQEASKGTLAKDLHPDLFAHFARPH